ncbi:hypothetical protein [Thalassotalea sp. G2M2-11]|uniref:hypothetical protein n=1 Tax=Thalassotalea sp. G2M2-11 TaxID=2787627 RepID=UPI0019D04310|nr:hypothetical protein [Thalassotalea sp. G2M2-11]
MFSLFNQKPFVDEDTRQWLLDTFAWADKYFTTNIYHTDAQVILPTNQCYPGRVNSVEQLVETIFQQTILYAGMEKWPITLNSMTHYDNHTAPLLAFAGPLRGENVDCQMIESSQPLQVVYNPAQINQPQDLIAFYVQQLAYMLIQQQQVLPPGGKELIPQAIEVVACAMGFGVIFANTAYQFKGGCGSCYNPRANRQAALPEQEVLYTLAIWSHVKQVHPKKILPHLKSHLRSPYKKMTKEVRQLLAGSKSEQFLSLQ